MLKRRGLAAGLAKLHAHRWRHTFAHEWKRAGADTGDLMLLLGWTSQEMPAATVPAPPPSAPRKPTSGSGSATMSEPGAMTVRRAALREQRLAFRAVTVIAGAVVGLVFLFGFGNVWTLALRLGVSAWVAPLVAPAVDLSVLALLLAIRYLALCGATPETLRPARRLLLLASLLTLALNVTEPLPWARTGGRLSPTVQTRQARGATPEPATSTSPHPQAPSTALRLSRAGIVPTRLRTITHSCHSSRPSTRSGDQARLSAVPNG
jgi:hypothetical protein